MGIHAGVDCLSPWEGDTSHQGWGLLGPPATHRRLYACAGPAVSGFVVTMPVWVVVCSAPPPVLSHVNELAYPSEKLIKLILMCSKLP